MQAMIGALEALPLSRVGFAALLTMASYFALCGCELLALAYAGWRLPYRRVVFATWVTYGLGQSIGLPLVAGTATRARVYSRWGLGAGDLVRIVGFSAATSWLGVLSVFGTALIWNGRLVSATIQLPASVASSIGAVALAAVASYLAFSLARRSAIMIAGHRISFPRPRVALAQVGIAAFDWLLAAGVLYTLLPVSGRPSYAAFLPLFAAAQMAGLVSHLPGGIGVFDAVVLAGLTTNGNSDALQIIASLAAFRGIYYMAPLAVGGALLAWSECAALVRRRGRRILAAAESHQPTLLAAATFAAGAMLLFSSATPAIADRTRILDQISFGPVTESAYFFASLAGVALLLISRGLHRRLDGAYVLAVGLLVAGITFSLLKGLDYEEAVVLATVLTFLAPARGKFSRRASLLAEPFTVFWVVGIVLVLSAAVSLAVFSSSHVLFSSAHWWHFSLTGGTSVSLVSTLAAVCAAALAGGACLLRMVPPPLAGPDASEIGKLREVVAGAEHTVANLALVGDKAVLFSDDYKSFLMYGVSGRSWVAMGDPVGPAAIRVELARRFRALAQQNGGRALFYLVAPENLPAYVDLGFSVIKVGETALVALDTFTLDGGSRKSLRRARKNAIASGCEFSVVAAREIHPLLPELRRVSDGWLALKHRKEKGFSLGYFDDRYLEQCPAAVVRRNGRVIGFANIWQSPEAGELSVDLMRYAPDAPPGMMDYLLSEVMLWGKAQGYRSFDLGMAPLAGMESGDGAPAWHRLAALVFSRSHRFYNFDGVRKYKEKFEPSWRGRYVALPAGLHPALALADVTKLVARLRSESPAAGTYRTSRPTASRRPPDAIAIRGCA